MSQLTADVSRKYKVSEDLRSEQPVAASATIYAGSAVGKSSGYARQLVAGDVFLGFADAKASNVADANKPNFAIGGVLLGAAGAINVPVREQGIVYISTITGATGLVTNAGTKVYMSDGNTFTTTVTGNTLIGEIVGYKNSAFEVFFQTLARRVG